MSFVDLLGVGTRAAQDRMILLLAVAAAGGDVTEDALIAHMARAIPPWTWEAVVHCCADLAEGGALDRVRNERGDVVGWRLTPAVSHHLAVCAASGVADTEAMHAVVSDIRMRAPAWLPSKAPKPTTTSTTVMKAVEPC